MKYIVSYIFLLLLLPLISVSQIENYTFKLYTNSYSLGDFDASPQIFDITQDSKGVMYFANQNGFIEYDGNSWSYINLYPETEINAVEIDQNGVIYAGGIGEFGYLSVEDSGRTKYKSLKHLLTTDYDFKKIINIKIDRNNDVFFQSKGFIFIYDGEKIKVLKSEEEDSFHESFLHDDVFHVRVDNKGIMKYINGEFILSEGGQFFSKMSVFAIINFNNKKIVVTDNRGIFEIQKNGDAVKTDIPELKDQTLYRSISVNDAYVSFGTFGNGVFLMDKNYNLKYIIDQKSGLLDGVIQCQFVDRDGNLWIGTNNGISKVMINSPISLYNLKEHKISTVESIIEFNHRLYIATFNGVYYANQDDLNEGLNKIKEIDVDCYGFMIFPAEKDTFLLIAAVDAIYSLNTKGAVKKIADGAPYDMILDHNNPSRINVCNYNGLSSIMWTGDRFVDEGYVSNFSEDVYNFKYDKDGTLYFGTKKKGLFSTTYKIFDDPNEPIVNISSELGITNEDGHAYIEIIDDKIFVGSHKGLYVKDENGWSKLNFFGNSEFTNYGVHRIRELSNGDIWVVLYDEKNNYKFEIGYLRIVNGNYEWHAEDFKIYSDELIHSIYKDKDQIIWLGGIENIFRYDPEFNKTKRKPFYTLIRNIKWGENSLFKGGYDTFIDTLNETTVNKDPMIFDYSSNRLEFKYSATNFFSENATEFSHFLEGQDKSWSVWENESKCDYTNLPEGNYIFRVRSKNYLGDFGKESSFSFTILPPWYRTVWAYFGYFLMLIILIVLGVRIGTIRIKKQKDHLESIVAERTQEVIEQKNEIEEQREELQELFNDVTDSIKYAKRLQDSILPPDDYIKELFPDSFVYYRPKDIVSGDFYWAHKSGGKNMIAAVDCTGHGVPGAFMSLVGANGLNAAINEHQYVKPSDILDDLNRFSYSSLNKDSDGVAVRDGMDMTLIAYDPKSKKLDFAGAFNPLYLVSKSEMNVIKGDRFAIGSFKPGENQFKNQSMKLNTGDVVYLFSDGYPDQFGGLKGKKFMGRNFRQLLLEISELSMEEQKNTLHQRMESWRGGHEQVDDILVIGFRVT